MAEVDYHREFVGTHKADAAVALVAGFTGEARDFVGTARALAQHGYDVFIYDYGTSVLTAGNPDAVYGLIDAISQDFMTRAGNYATRRYSGVSMGVGIAWNMQKRDPGQVEPGLYGAAGADVAHIVFHNPLFRQAKKAFMRNGYSEQALHDHWRSLHEPPRTPFVVALGGRDLIVSRREVMSKIRAWQRTGVPVLGVTQWRATHSAMIRWFRRHIRDLDALASHLEAQS